MNKQLSSRTAAQAGFTLIELVIVIVIIGILAAVAIPKYTSLTTDAQLASTKGIAGNLGSAAATNYAIHTANAAKGSAITDCAGISALVSGWDSTSYTISAGALSAAGVSATCTVTGPGAQTATFVGIGA